MKKKTRLSVIIGLIILIGSTLSLTSQAQEHQKRKQQGPPPIPNEKEVDKMVNDLSKTLSLSEEQTKKISKMYTKHFDEVRSKVDESRPKREEMEQLRSDFVKDVKSVLDEDQKKKFDEFHQKKGKRKKAENHLKQ